MEPCRRPQTLRYSATLGVVVQQMLARRTAAQHDAANAGRISHVRGGDPSFQCPYLRCAWSAAKEEDLAEGMRRVGRAVRRHLDSGGGGGGAAGPPAQPTLNGQISRIQL